MSVPDDRFYCLSIDDLKEDKCALFERKTGHVMHFVAKWIEILVLMNMTMQ
jgi:hypothetical protein